MTAFAVAPIAAAGALATIAWLLASWRGGSTWWTLAVVLTTGYASLLTWQVVALNRAGLGLPSGALPPAIGDARAAGLTYAWAIVVAQGLTFRRFRPAAAELAPLLVGLALLAWPRTGLYGSWTSGVVYRGDAATTYLLAASVAASVLAFRVLVARLAPTWRGGGRGEQVVAAASSAIAVVALLVLARRAATVQGLGAANTAWLAALAALHLVAVGSTLVRSPASRMPLVPAAVALATLLGYLLSSSASRLPGA